MKYDKLFNLFNSEEKKKFVLFISTYVVKSTIFLRNEFKNITHYRFIYGIRRD